MSAIINHFNCCQKIVASRKEQGLWSEEDEADFNEKSLQRVQQIMEKRGSRVDKLRNML